MQQQSLNNINKSSYYGVRLGTGQSSTVYIDTRSDNRVVKCFKSKIFYQSQKGNHLQCKNRIKNTPLQNKINLMELFDDKKRQLTFKRMATTLEDYIVDKEDYIVNKKVTKQITKKWSLQLLSILKQLHSLNIGHADFKAKNIMLNNKKQLIICDLGLMHFLQNNITTRHINKTTLRPQQLQTQNTVIVDTISSDFQQLTWIVMQMKLGFPFLVKDQPECHNALMWKNKIQIKGDNLNTHDLNPQMYTIIPQINYFFQVKSQNNNVVDDKNVQNLINKLFQN